MRYSFIPFFVAALLLSSCAVTNTKAVPSRNAKDDLAALAAFAQRQLILGTQGDFEHLPVVETSVKEFEGTYEPVVQTIRSVQGHPEYSEAACRGTVFAELAKEFDCSFAIVLEAIRRIQDRESQSDYVKRLALWYGDLKFYPEHEPCLHEDRPHNESVEILVENSYRLVWINLACRPDAIYVRGSGWLEASRINCRTYSNSAAVASNVLAFVDRTCPPISSRTRGGS